MTIYVQVLYNLHVSQSEKPGNGNKQGTRKSTLLKDLLASTTFAPNRALANDIRILDLGVFGDEADLLFTKLQAQPRIDILGKIVYVMPDRRVMLQNSAVSKDPVRGMIAMPLSVQRRVYSGNQPKELTQDKFVGLSLYAVLTNVVPAHNLAPLICGDDYPAAHTAIMLVSPHGKDLFMRGERSPSPDVDVVQRQIVESRVNLEQNKKFLNLENASQDEISRIFLKQVVSTFDLRHFRCPFGENIATPAIENFLR